MIVMICVSLGFLLGLAVAIGLVDASQASAWRRIAAERRRNWEQRQLKLYGIYPRIKDENWDETTTSPGTIGNSPGSRAGGRTQVREAKPDVQWPSGRSRATSSPRLRTPTFANTRTAQPVSGQHRLFTTSSGVDESGCGCGQHRPWIQRPAQSRDCIEDHDRGSTVK